MIASVVVSYEETIRTALDDVGLLDTHQSADPLLSIRPAPTPMFPEDEPLTAVRVGERDADLRTTELILGRELGRGGMGVVRTAWQVALGREVAVKRLHELHSPGARAGLLREARIIGALEHPNIPPVHLLGRDVDGRPLLMMKRIDGTPLSSMLDDPDHARWAMVRGARLDWCLQVLMQVANAVHFAHRHGYLHRDIKPENVMVGDFGEVYLLDWGIAVRIDDLRDDREAGRPMTLVGTPAYLAPEMIDATAGYVGPRTDVYLLGGLLHHMLTGAPPHRGGDLIAVLLQSFATEYTYPEGTPDALVDIARRALAPKPNDRYEDPEQLRVALLDFLQTRSSVDLVRQAREKHRRLETLVDDRVAQYRIFGECRFAYEEALRVTPDLPDARAGLTAAIALMAAHELQRDNAEGAELLIAELAEEDRGDLPARLETLKAEEAHQEERFRQLQDLEADLDVSAGGRARAYTALGITCGIAVSGLYLLEWLDLGGERAWMSGRLGLLSVVVIVGALFRRTLFANQAAKKIGLSILTLGIVAPVHLWLSIVMDVPIEKVLVQDLLLLGTGLGILAVTMDRRTLLSSAAALAGACAGAVWPLYISHAVALTLVAVVAIQVLIWGTTRPRAT